MDGIQQVNGNLQQLASMVRGNRTSRPVAASTNDSDASERLPSSTRKIVRGLATAAQPPLPDDAELDELLTQLNGSFDDSPELAFAAQGGIGPGSVLALN